MAYSDVPADAEVQAVIEACATLGPPAEWQAFIGYPDSLALSILDSIWSLNVRYVVASGVVSRYRHHRQWQGGAERDGCSDLISVFSDLGGVAEFNRKIGTRNKVSTQPGAATKGEAVLLAATALHELGIDTADDFREADRTGAGNDARSEWLRVPGQGRGTSWRYLRMLLGLPDVKPDRMTTRFVAAALGVDENAVTPDRVVSLVQAAAEHFGVDQRALDHEIWNYQSGKRGQHDQISQQTVLAELATGFIAAALQTLEADHVIPTPRGHRFLQIGRDYFGDEVHSQELAALDAALNEMFPQRFDRPLTQEGTDLPHFHEYALLEAVIARCGRAGDGAWEVDNPVVQESIQEFIAELESETYGIGFCRLTSHLTTADGGPLASTTSTSYPRMTATRSCGGPSSEFLRRSAR